MPKYNQFDVSIPIAECEAGCSHTYVGAIAHGFRCAAYPKLYDLRTGEKISNPAADRRTQMFENVIMEDHNDFKITNHNEAYANVAIHDGIDHRLSGSNRQ